MKSAVVAMVVLSLICIAVIFWGDKQRHWMSEAVVSVKTFAGSVSGVASNVIHTNVNDCHSDDDVTKSACLERHESPLSIIDGRLGGSDQHRALYKAME